MTERSTRKTLPLNQLLLILMGILVLYLLIDFGQQIRISQQQRERLDRLEQEILAAEQEQQQLMDEQAHVQSDEAVEIWARANGLSQPDEVPVVVIAPPGEPAGPGQQNPSQSLSPDQAREAWWDLFFGSP